MIRSGVNEYTPSMAAPRIASWSARSCWPVRSVAATQVNDEPSLGSLSVSASRPMGARWIRDGDIRAASGVRPAALSGYQRPATGAYTLPSNNRRAVRLKRATMGGPNAVTIPE